MTSPWRANSGTPPVPSIVASRRCQGHLAPSPVLPLRSMRGRMAFNKYPQLREAIEGDYVARPIHGSCQCDDGQWMSMRDRGGFFTAVGIGLVERVLSLIHI